MSRGGKNQKVLAYLLKGYPRLSETFIINEILLLERLGFRLRIYALRNPNEPRVHTNVRHIAAPVSYIPDYFWRSFRALVGANLRLFLDRPAVYWRSFRAAAGRSLSRRSSSTIKRFLQAGYLVQRHLREEAAAHLHAHFLHGPATTALFASALSGIPYSVTAHAKDIYIQEEDFLRTKVDRAEFIVTCTEYNRVALGKMYTGTTPVHRIYHGVDLASFRARPGPRPSGAPRILSVGRLVPKKGFPVLIHALRRLADRGVEFQCDIVGGGPQREELRELIEARGLARAVTLRGPMTQEELVRYYESADCIALACEVQPDGDRDGIPNVLVEAAAMGVPLVSTRISGIPELIEDGVTGLLVPPGDPEALAGALERLIVDRELAAELARGARTRVAEDYDSRRNTERLGELFEHALRAAEVGEGTRSLLPQ